jgi:hypothetical protein
LGSPARSGQDEGYPIGRRLEIIGFAMKQNILNLPPMSGLEMKLIKSVSRIRLDRYHTNFYYTTVFKSSKIGVKS